jgi:hypothetical protein
MATPPLQPQVGQPHLRYVDRPEVSETFANSSRRLTFDGANFHLEFVVNRMDDPAPPAPPTGKQITVCRLVVPLVGAVELRDNLTRLIEALNAQGVIQRIQAGPTSVN